jgi:uncharacterized protein with PIN domain
MASQQSANEEVEVTGRTAESRCTVVKREDLVPVCPHCESELPEIHAHKPRGSFGIGRGFVFFCPHCRKVLGFGTQWYPFPG